MLRSGFSMLFFDTAGPGVQRPDPREWALGTGRGPVRSLVRGRWSDMEHLRHDIDGYQKDLTLEATEQGDRAPLIPRADAASWTCLLCLVEWRKRGLRVTLLRRIHHSQTTKERRHQRVGDP